MHSKQTDRTSRKTILYANYKPYGNAGCILDYLKSSFEEIANVSLVFHPVEAESSNTIEIIRNGSVEKKFGIPTFRAPKKYVHQMAFLISLYTGLELMSLTLYLRFKHGIKPELFLSPNAFLVFVGVVMRSLRLVREVVFWVWDYYPPPEKGFYRRFLFRLYWRLDLWCTRKADFVWYLNDRLLDVRTHMGVKDDVRKNYVAPLGIDPIDQEHLPDIKPDTIGFVGVLKKGQGLDLLIDTLPDLSKARPNLKVEVIGSGPDEAYFKERAGTNREGNRISFLGFIESDDDMRKTIATWSAAVALYVPTYDNVASFTDPSKVRLYLGCGVPVIMTGAPQISETIGRRKAGVVIDYVGEQLVEAVDEILKDNGTFRENSLTMAQDYKYRPLYNRVFDRMFDILNTESRDNT